MRIAIAGGTGFVGSHLSRALLKAGHQVVLISRGRTDRRRHDEPGLTSIRADVTADVPALTTALRGCGAVVNLVGILHERGSTTFDNVHRQGTENIVAAALAAGVGHIVQVSVVGAGPNPRYPYLLSKWAAEEAVRLATPNHTIIRPGVLFGSGDQFFTRLTRAIRLGRVVAPMVGGGGALFQPLAVDDLSRAVVTVVEEGPQRAVIEVGGPELMSFDEIVNAIKTAVGIRRFNVHIPAAAAMPMALLMENVSRRPAMTRGQIRLLEVHQITRRDSMRHYFGFEPQRFADAAAYLERY